MSCLPSRNNVNTSLAHSQLVGPSVSYMYGCLFNIKVDTMSICLLVLETGPYFKKKRFRKYFAALKGKNIDVQDRVYIVRIDLTADF